MRKFKKKIKNRSNSSKGFRSNETINEEERGWRLRDYYQQPSHITRQRKEPTPRESIVDILYSQEKDGVGVYLDWEMMME